MITFSIIQKSQLGLENRIDAECYQPEYLQMEERLSRFKCKEIAEISKSVINFGAYSLCNYISFLDEGIPFLVTDDIHNNLIDNKNLHYISKDVHQILHKSHCMKNQVLLTMAGAYLGQAAVYDFNFVSSSNQAIAKITLKEEGLDPYFLSTFLVSKYGQFQIERLKTVTGQPNINLGQIKKIIVPILDNKTQKSLRNIIIRAKSCLIESGDLMIQVEDLLLEELRLKDFKVEDDLSFVVNLSDVKSANRVDAEYFQPKYKKLIDQIKSHNAKMLGDLVSMKKGFEPGSEAYQEEGELFIRVSSLSKFGIDAKDQKYLSKDLYESLKKDFEPQASEVLLTKDATPGIAYVVKEPIEGVISGGILRLKVKTDLDQEYLALCINSIIGKWQAERDAGGSVIAHWKPEQIKNLLIPVIPKPTQQKIAELVRKSHEARKKSKQLLEEAKRKVEEMIEKGGSSS